MQVFPDCYYTWGTAVAQWLKCCATNQKDAGSIPAGVNGFFIDIKSFRSHYGPGVDSVSNRNEYQECFLGVESGRCVRLTTYHHPVPLSRNLGTLTSWNPLGLSRPVMGLLYLYRLYQAQNADLDEWPTACRPIRVVRMAILSVALIRVEGASVWKRYQRRFVASGVWRSVLRCTVCS